jgi:hypothetical protein
LVGISEISWKMSHSFNEAKVFIKFQKVFQLEDTSIRNILDAVVSSASFPRENATKYLSATSFVLFFN